MSAIALSRKSKSSLSSANRITGNVVGVLVRVNEQGAPYVDFPGNSTGPVKARVVGDLGGVSGSKLTCGSAVFLMFENGDASLPLILGVVSEQLPPAAELIAMPRRVGQDVIVDGARVIFDAQREIVLRCGKGSITLTADGKVVVKGTNLVSRASGTNKVKGASVNIN